MIDVYTAERQAFVRNLPRETTMQRKVSEAKQRMGETYLFHPANRVQRVNAKPPVLR